MTRLELGRVTPRHRRSPGVSSPRGHVRDQSVGRYGESGTARIAVDLLGGDHAPAVVVDGALRACRADPALRLLIVGPVKVAGAVLGGLKPADRARFQVAPPTAGTSGVRAAVLAVRAGHADAVISAGSTGETVVAATLGLGRWRGVRHPILAAVLPAGSGRVLLLDVGACVDPGAATLASHALLGAAYASAAHGFVEARVGLLTIGTEVGKGDRLRRAAAALLADLPLPAGARYVGLVEGHDVVYGERADIVVTDGFTGNVLLKGIEAAAAVRTGPVPMDLTPRAAALLGVAGTVVVCHGAATAIELASGIALAAQLHRRDAVAATAALLPDRAAGDARPTGVRNSRSSDKKVN